MIDLITDDFQAFHTILKIFLPSSIIGIEFLVEGFIYLHGVGPNMPRIQGRTDPRSQKLTFFCHGCGFEGDMYEDFVVDLSGEYLEYFCPECAELLSKRPHSAR